MDIRIGDTVQVKNGGPEMTVAQVFKDSDCREPSSLQGTVLCIWLAGTSFCNAIFHPESLELVEEGYC